MTDYIILNYMDDDECVTSLIPVEAIESTESINGLDELKSINGKLINGKATSVKETAIILKIDQLIHYRDDEYSTSDPSELVARAERGKWIGYCMTDTTTLSNINIVGMVSTGFIF